MTEHGDQGPKELATAIRVGSERRPEQAFGDYFIGRHASCALGAAYEQIANWLDPPDLETRPGIPGCRQSSGYCARATSSWSTAFAWGRSAGSPCTASSRVSSSACGPSR